MIHTLKKARFNTILLSALFLISLIEHISSNSNWWWTWTIIGSLAFVCTVLDILSFNAVIKEQKESEEWMKRFDEYEDESIPFDAVTKEKQ